MADNKIILGLTGSVPQTHFKCKPKDAQFLIYSSTVFADNLTTLLALYPKSSLDYLSYLIQYKHYMKIVIKDN